MASELVSVIIPAFNASRYIDRTIESVLSQTYQNLEVLIVDDGSTDDTPVIIQSYAQRDSRIKFLQQENRGVAAARNLAIHHSSGYYVAPIDADDVWMPDKIERQVRVMEERGPSCGIVYCWWTIIDEYDHELLRTYPWTIIGDVADDHVALNFIGNASVPLFRRASIEKVGGYEPAFRHMGAQGCEDWDLSLRVSDFFELHLVPAYLVGYRRAMGSMSANFSTMMRSHELMIERTRSRRPTVTEKVVRQSRGLMYGYIIMAAVRMRRPGAAIYWLLKGLLSAHVSFRSRWVKELLRDKLNPEVLRRMKLQLSRSASRS